MKTPIIALAAIGVITCSSCGKYDEVVRDTYHYQVQVGGPLRQELGFSHSSPYVKCGGLTREVFTLHPATNGLLYQAGVRDGDIVLNFSITDFYRQLEQARGGTTVLQVVEGGDGPTLNERATRIITIAVPDRSGTSIKERATTTQQSPPDYSEPGTGPQK